VPEGRNDRLMLVTEKMELLQDIEGKRVLVAGLARSGAAAASLLAGLGARVTVTDMKPADELSRYIDMIPPGVRIIAGANPVEEFEAADLIVVSPGVPLDSPSVRAAMNAGRPVIGELEAAYQALRIIKHRMRGTSVADTHLLSPHIIAITGTNGKSTVTTLVDLMLREFGYSSVAAGNIGRAVSGVVGGMAEAVESGQAGRDRIPDYIVAEISSFQLETIQDFRPRISAILNVSPDHLDRYASMDDYIGAKERIFMNQRPDDYLILNADDPALKRLRLRGDIQSRVLCFSRKERVRGVYLRDGVIWCNLPDIHVDCKDNPVISEEKIRIRGTHNTENAMAAILMAVLAGASINAVTGVLREFSGLEHRLEFVREINGVTFINDSKATNVGAVIKSLEGLKNVILIMGGLDKGGDFSVLSGAVSGRVSHLFLIGSAAGKIAAALSGSVGTTIVRDLDEAVRQAFARASAGDTVLLAPGCASFDMFMDFEDRGRRFREAVKAL
jgi:UDP-N-acetylmuramoylalanine--D-glutamate ligase